MRIALLGATGAVGRTMLAVLSERAIDVDELRPLASERSRGQSVALAGREWSVDAPRPGVFRGCDIALFSAGAARSREWAPVAVAEGAVVIDNSSAWRMDPDVPLVVPEVNARAADHRPRGIVANPNCSTIQLVVALEAIRRVAGLKRVIATTLQSVSGAGQTGIDALRAERAGSRLAATPFPAAIDGNAIPCIGAFGADGFTEEEMKVRAESRKILGLPDLLVSATCVRVPVEVGHSISAVVETERALDAAGAVAALRDMPGVRVLDGETLPLARDAAGQDDVLVGRVRQDPDAPRTLHLWIVADNLRKGAATNAVQIAEHVLQMAGR
ncbi:MAG TPA: aspartate-semialdehyde dehydrogenase [Longimicrobiales bacterium]|nr:aspartate-semialdehyde dehydrogenase [Longimicrobiales bacterium]